MPIEEIEVDSVPKYLGLVNDLMFVRSVEQSAWIFRGVSDKTHELEVSLRWVRRDLAGEPTTASAYSSVKEAEIFYRFKRAALAVTNLSDIPDLDWMCLARHHTLPCRVLDWSESPLVAAYFANADMGAKAHSAVYATRMPSLVSEQEARKPFDITSVKTYQPIPISPRISAQSAVVTVHPEPMKKFDPDVLIRFVFPPKLQGGIKMQLNKYGIHHQSMFPDLDGLATNLRWLYKWDLL